MQVQAAATAFFHRPNHLDAVGVQQPLRRGVRFRCRHALYAALQHQRALGRPEFRFRRCLPCRAFRFRPPGQYLSDHPWQQPTEPAAEADPERERLRFRRRPAEPLPGGRIPGQAPCPFFHHLPADLQQFAVLDPGRAGDLAAAAGQATVEVGAHGAHAFRIRLGFLEKPLDEIDAPARPVELVAEQLIGGADGVAHAAVHAGAQDLVGPPPLGRGEEVLRQPRLHRRFRD